MPVTPTTPDAATPFSIIGSPSGIPRATVFETYQIGNEDPSAKGTAVAATKRLLGIEMNCEAVTPTMDVEAAGAKSPVDVIRQKDSTRASFKGALCFNTIPYLLSSGLTLAEITALETGVHQFDFIPQVFGPDTLQTYTVMKGSAAAAEGFTFGQVNGMELSFSEKQAEMSGDMIGQRLVDAITMTASPTDIAISAVSPDTLDVYVADSVAGLAAGHLGTCFMAKWGFKDRVKSRFTLNTSQTSFKDTVESKFNMTSQIVIEEDDTVAAAYMATLRARGKKYARIKMTGALIGATQFETIEITFPFKFKGNKPGDNEGTYAGTFDLLPIYDASFGGIVEIRVVTALAAL